MLKPDHYIISTLLMNGGIIAAWWVASCSQISYVSQDPPLPMPSRAAALRWLSYLLVRQNMALPSNMQHTSQQMLIKENPCPPWVSWDSCKFWTIVPNAWLLFPWIVQEKSEAWHDMTFFLAGFVPGPRSLLWIDPDLQGCASCHNWW